MNEDLYSQKRAWLKHNDRPEVVLLAAGDPERVKIMVAWNNLEVQRGEKLAAGTPNRLRLMTFSN